MQEKQIHSSIFLFHIEAKNFSLEKNIKTPYFYKDIKIDVTHKSKIKTSLIAIELFY